MADFGAPRPLENTAAGAVAAARDMVDQFNTARATSNDAGIIAGRQDT
ncbi:MAG: hypothetical protein HKN30_07835 [Sulfitobacter sp.]|nr:hypothetical protein [Sulfitobacter sp.]